MALAYGPVPHMAGAASSPIIDRPELARLCVGDEAGPIGGDGLTLPRLAQIAMDKRDNAVNLARRALAGMACRGALVSAAKGL